jgi:hypothetical protein
MEIKSDFNLSLMAVFLDFGKRANNFIALIAS